MTLVAVNGSSTDKNGNKVLAPAGLKNVYVEFSGRNNELVIAGDSGVNNTKFYFPADDGICIVGSRGNYSGRVRVGWKCLVSIGTWVTCTTACSIYTAEATSVVIGDDCMFAASIQIRTEDSHAIFDVESGERINPSRDIAIGQHVWLAEDSLILSGSTIGAGSVIGTRSLVKGFIPNNCVAAGSPARVIKKDAAWERPNIAFAAPWVRSNGREQELVRTPRCWQKTDEAQSAVVLGKGCYTSLMSHDRASKCFDMSRFSL
ncbi:Maltose O-acetyltransferase [compost metagenome]